LPGHVQGLAAQVLAACCAHVPQFAAGVLC
jgi:hypothetical protein